MRFEIASEILDGEDRLLARIDRIVDRLADGVHEVEVDASRLRSTKWFASTRATRRQLLMQASSTPPVRGRARGRALHSKRYSVNNAVECEVAEKLAHTSLTILVEDREADGRLLELIVDELAPPEMQRVWRAAVSPPSVRVDSSGGIGSMQARLERALADAHGEGRPARVFVLCDSDRRWPGDEDAEGTKVAIRVRAFCEAQDVPCHVLCKRTVENYIPDQVFRELLDDPEWTSRHATIRALLDLNATQRDHLPIKDGLSTNERERASATGLYNPEDDERLALLEKRIFRRSPRPMVALTDERRGAFTARGMSERDGAGELRVLLDKIFKEL